MEFDRRPYAEQQRKKWLRYENDIRDWLHLRLDEWIKAKYPPAQTFFTDGLERYVAYLIESAMPPKPQGY